MKENPAPICPSNSNDFFFSENSLTNKDIFEKWRTTPPDARTLEITRLAT